MSMNRWLLYLVATAMLLFVCLPAGKALASQQEVRIDILGTQLGGSGYNLSYALSDLINKHSQWLRATVVETSGMVENVRTLAEQPDRRKTTIIYAESLSMYQAKVADPPFKKPYTTLKIISRLYESPIVLATLNPKIQSYKDLIGKKVSIGPPGFGGYQHMIRILKYGWGILDKVKIEPLGLGPGKDALIDGLIDVALQAFIITTPGETASKPRQVTPTPAAQELIYRANPYWVNMDSEALDKARKETGYPIFRVEIPAAFLGPKQLDPIGGEMVNMNWSCDIEMPENVVSEICRVIYENWNKFKDYDATGKSVVQKAMGMVVGTVGEDFHPGAVKFYKKYGVKIGD